MQEKHSPSPKPPHIWDQKSEQGNQNKGILEIDSHCPWIYYLEKLPHI